MNTCKSAYQSLQTVVATDPDGVPGLKTDNAVARLRAAAIATPDAPWPVSQPVPAPPVGALVYGADTVDLISAVSIAEMTELIGRTPAFVARYFNGPYEYHHSQENGPAAAAGIKVLCIGDQTPRVGGIQYDGAADGIKNATDIIITFGSDYLAGLGSEFWTVLDIEGKPSLSVAYWTGWSAAVMAQSKLLTGGRVTLLPCAYASENDGPTWKALGNAMLAGAQCFGSWVAAYIATKPTNLPIAPQWNASKARMNTGDGTPAPTCPVLIWQYEGGNEGTKWEAHDANLLNPATDASAFLARCVTPPGAIA